MIVVVERIVLEVEVCSYFPKNRFCEMRTVAKKNDIMIFRNVIIFRNDVTHHLNTVKSNQKLALALTPKISCLKLKHRRAAGN